MKPLHAFARRYGGEMWFRALGKRLVGIDMALQKRTKAKRSLMGFAGVHGLVLTTRGRKSGQARVSPLLYVRADGGYVVAGSNWGGQKHPGWSANLLAEPRASVAIDGREESVLARLVAGQERERLWSELVDAWPAFRSYAKGTDREIRVFLLSRQEN